MSKALMMGDKFVDAVRERDKQVYGRNLSLRTSDEFAKINVGGFSGSLKDGGATSKYVYTLEDLQAEPGDALTASMYVGESEEGYGGGFRIDDQEGGNKYSTYKLAKNGYVSETFTILPETTEIRIYTTGQSQTGATSRYFLPVKELKLEKGSLATPWTPAPEDFVIPRYELMII